MSVVIGSVAHGSPCYKKGIRAGDKLNTINGHEIIDVLDYRFWADSPVLHMEIERADGRRRNVKVRNNGDIDALGLDFPTYLMDCQQHCKNKCVFCFIDQLPKGMRDTLYFKDDDSRLSFLFGNYITLTNMTEREVQRILDMHISPINISVHTMNPSLRVKMMKNPKAGESISIIERFAAGNIKMNAQIVLVPEMNDGAELDFSLEKLGELYPAVQSIAVVPVGLTSYREGLPNLRMFTGAEAGTVIDQIDAFNRKFYDVHDGNLAFAADEFYLNAKREMPPKEYYGDFDQLENGVGMWTLTDSGFKDALEGLTDDEASKVKPRKTAIITGMAAAPLMTCIGNEIMERFPQVSVNVFPIINDYFGHNITVAGLVTGGDIMKQIENLKDYDEAFIPDVMMKAPDELIFLDDVTLEQVSEKLGVKITPQKSDGYDILYNILGLG